MAIPQARLRHLARNTRTGGAAYFGEKANADAFKKELRELGRTFGTIRSSGPTMEGQRYKQKAYGVIVHEKRPKAKRQQSGTIWDMF